jgi:hypothetical protein
MSRDTERLVDQLRQAAYRIEVFGGPDAVYVVHRPIPGIHVPADDDCWCCPTLVSRADLRDCRTLASTIAAAQRPN